MCMLNHITHHGMYKFFINFLFSFILVSIYVCVLKTSSLDENNLLYECNVLWNRFVKKIESLILKILI
jgi:hypothetical protein